MYLVGMLDGLAFLPLDQIVQGMEHLRNVQPPEAQQLTEYFDATYVSGIQRLTEYFDATYISGIQRRVNAAGEIRRVPPCFIPALWNVHEETLTDNPRTNNTVEGWNNKNFVIFFLFMHFCQGTITTHAESINSDLQRGLDRPLRHTQH